MRNYLIPEDSRQLTLKEIKSNCIESTDFLEIREEERSSLKKSVIAENAALVMKDAKGVYTLTRDGHLWRTSTGNRILTKFKILDSGKKKTRMPVSTTTLISSNNLFKEEIFMTTSPMDKLKSLSEKNKANQMGGTPAGGANVPNKEDNKVLTEAQIARQERIAESKNIQSQLSRNISSVTLGNAIEVRTFNQKHGSLLAHVVVSDSLVKASVTSTPLLVNGKKQLAAGVSEEIRADFNANKAVPKKSYLLEYNLNLKEAAPTASRGMVLTVPKGGYVSVDDFRKSESVQFDPENKDLVTLALPKDTALFSILAYFGGTIKEDPRTHGELAGTLTVETSVTPKDGLPKTTFKLVPSTRKRVVIPGNYIPQKVYKKVSLESVVNGDDQAKQEANKSLFFNLFDAEKGKYKDLSNEHQELIGKEGDVYTSKYINEGKAPSIASYMQLKKEKELIANPMIPLKSFALNKAGTKELGKYQAYNILKPDTDYADLSPEVTKEFKVIREVLGNMSIATAVSSCIRTKRGNNGGGGTKVTLSNDDAMRTLLQKAEGKSAGITIDSAFDRDALNEIYSLVADIKY